MLGRVCVFCGASTGADPAFAASARALAAELVARGIGLVYGGGDVGLMGALADEVLGLGGEVIGVIPHHLVELEVAHHGVDLRVVATMHERKALMYDLADAVVALPGGFGTLDELFEVLTWVQLGLHAVPVGLLDPTGYFGHLVAFLDHAVASGLLRAEHRAHLLVEADPAALLDALSRVKAPVVPKWLDPRQR